MDNLETYLGSIERVRAGVQSLTEANLGFCRVTLRRLVHDPRQVGQLLLIPWHPRSRPQTWPWRPSPQNTASG